MDMDQKEEPFSSGDNLSSLLSLFPPAEHHHNHTQGNGDDDDDGMESEDDDDDDNPTRSGSSSASSISCSTSRLARGQTERQKTVEQVIKKQQHLTLTDINFPPPHIRCLVERDDQRHLCIYADTWKADWPAQPGFPNVRPVQLSNWLFFDIQHLKDYKLPQTITLPGPKPDMSPIVLETLYDLMVEELTVARPSFVDGRVLKEKKRNSFAAFRLGTSIATGRSYLGVPKYYGLSRFPLPSTIFANWQPLPLSQRKQTDTDAISTKHENPFAFFNPAFRPRSQVQEEAIAAYMKHLHPEFGGGGCIVLNCNEGKTFVGAQCIHKTLGGLCTRPGERRVRLVWVINKTELAIQARNELERFFPHLKTAVLGGDVAPEVDFDATDAFIVLVQKMQWVEFPPEVQREVRMIVVDECHHGAAVTFIKTLQYFEPQYTLGLSATPHRSDELSYLMYWYVGPIVYVYFRDKPFVPTTSVFLKPNGASHPFFTGEAPRITTRKRDQVLDWLGLQSLVGQEPSRVEAVLDLVLRHQACYPSLQIVVFCQYVWQCKAIAFILNKQLGVDEEEIRMEEAQAKALSRRSRKRKREDGDGDDGDDDDDDDDAARGPPKKKQKRKANDCAGDSSSKSELPAIKPRAVAYHGKLSTVIRQLHCKTTGILASTKEMLDEGINLPRLAMIGVLGIWKNIEQMFGRVGRSPEFVQHAIVIDFQEKDSDQVLRKISYGHRRQFKDASHFVSTIVYSPSTPVSYYTTTERKQLQPFPSTTYKCLHDMIYILMESRKEDEKEKEDLRKRQKERRVKRMIARARAAAIPRSEAEKRNTVALNIDDGMRISNGSHTARIK